MRHLRALSLASTLASTLVFSGLLGCATKIATQAEAPALGSDIAITAKKGKTGTYPVSLEVTNLAPADRLVEGMTTFVVWLSPTRQEPVRVGTLSYDPGSRRGALDLTSPDRTFVLLITLEKDGGAGKPSTHRIAEIPIEVR